MNSEYTYGLIIKPVVIESLFLSDEENNTKSSYFVAALQPQSSKAEPQSVSFSKKKTTQVY